MAKLIKCPRCQSNIDVTTSKGGGPIKCPECSAPVRVPTGETQKLQAPAGKMTPLFRKMSGSKSPGHAGKPQPRGGAGPERGGAAAPKGAQMQMYIIIGVVVAVIAVGGFVMMNNKGGTADEGTKKTATKKKKPEPVAPAPPPPPVAPPPPTGPTPPPANWEYDAVQRIGGGFPEKVDVDPAIDKEAIGYIKNPTPDSAKKFLFNPVKYMPTLLNALLSDDERTARSAFNILYALDEKMKLSNDGKPFVDFKMLNSALYRGNTYAHMHIWYTKMAKRDLSTVNFDEIITEMKGGALDDPETPQGANFMKLCRMGSPAWPRLVKYIDHEDIAFGKAAAAALNKLTGENKRIPNAVNKGEIKAEWDAWLKDNVK